MSNAIAWLNSTPRPGVYAGHVEGVLVGVVVNSTTPTSVEGKLAGKQGVTEQVTASTSLVNPQQESYKFNLHAAGKTYVGYFGPKRNSTEYSISLYKRDEPSESMLDSLFDTPPSANTTEEIDDDIPFG